MRIIFIALFLFVLTASAYAQDSGVYSNTTGGNLIGIKDQVIVDGSVSKDAILTGNSIKINGAIFGDLIAAGQTINSEARINGDVKAAGQSIVFANDIGGDIWAAGNSIETRGSINGDAIIFAQYYEANTIKGKLTFSGDKITINGNIGSAEITARQVSFGKDAKVLGSLKITSAQPLSDSDRTHVLGSISQMERNKPIAFLLDKVLRFIAAILLLSFIILLFPSALKDMSWKIYEHPIQTFFVGLVGVIIFPLGIILLLVTIVGIPLAVVLGATYIVLIYIAHLFFAYFIGDQMLPKMNAYLRSAIGIFILSLIFLIPILGVVSRAITVCFGLGSLMLLWHRPK